MQQRHHLAMIAIALLGQIGTPIVALASGGFACPTVGTKFEFRNGNNATYDGSVPGDALMCQRTTSWAGSQRLLYNYYVNNDFIDRSAGRQPLQELFEHKTDNISFEISKQTSGYTVLGPDRWIDSWSYQGMQTLSIDGRIIQTEIYIREETGVNHGNGFHGKWKLSYDPLSHLFVKSEYTPLSTFGVLSYQNWTVYKLQLP